MRGSRAENLNRAAKIIRRLAVIEGPDDFEGVPLLDIAADCTLAAAEEKLYESLSAMTLPDNVVPFPRHSMRVGA